MPRKPKGTQSQPDENPGKSTKTTTGKRAGTTRKVKTKNTREISRPRIVPKSNRAIQQGIEKAQQRKPRELSKTRGPGATVRPHALSTGLIQREEKSFPTGRTVSVKAETRGVSIFEEQASVKWVAWGALIVAIVSLVFLGIFSIRKFSPEAEFYDLKASQKQIAADVNELRFTTRLEEVRNVLMNAHVQLVLRKDYTIAESMLMKAKQELKDLSVSLPVEKKPKVKELLNNIEAILQEIQRSPTALAETLEKIVLDLDKL